MEYHKKPIPITKLELWRRIHGLTQTELARRCHVQQTLISKHEAMKLHLLDPAINRLMTYISSMGKECQYQLSFHDLDASRSWKWVVISHTYLKDIYRYLLNIY
jgi:predicted transcriptional regulator